MSGKNITDTESRDSADTYSSAGSEAAGAAAAPSPAAPAAGGGCKVGTAFEDLAGVEVGETLFVGEPWKKKQTKKPVFNTPSRLKGQ